MMIKQKGNRVRISSHKNLINDLEEYFHSESKCSCPVCDSISCFQIRRFNSGLSCTCLDCNRDRCLTWDNNDDSNHDNPPDTDAASKVSKASDTGIKPKKKCSAPMNDDKEESSCCTKDCNTPESKQIVSNDYAVQIEIKISDDFNPDSIKDRTSKKAFDEEDFFPEFYKKDDKQKVKSDFIKVKPVSMKCCSSNTCIESINAIPEHTEMNLDKNTSEYSDILYVEDKKAIASDENIEPTDTYISNTVESKDSITELINIIKNNGNREDWNSYNSKVKKECKECCSSKNFESKSSKSHNTKSSATEIEVQPKKKDSYSQNTGYLKTSKTIRNELYTKRYDDAKKVFNDDDFDNAKNRDIFTKENKNLEKCYNVSKYLRIEEDTQYRPKNKKERDSRAENDLTGKDSLNDDEIIRLQKIINLLTHIDDKQDNDGSNLKQCVYTDVSHKKKKTIRKKNEKTSEKSSSHLKSIALSYSKPDYSSSRAELSAQVMNVPYEELKETLSRRQSSVHSDVSNTPKELPKLDIFSKLKELYKACSCKVCECLPSNSFPKNNDICNCKPCDCDDCKKYTEKLRNRFLNRPPSGCPCVACDRKDCRGVVKDDTSNSVCDCEPCNCVRYTESYSKPCNCVPCQCELCKASVPMPQAVMVSNMTQIYHQSNCDCDPCECQNCTSSYSAMTSNLMREASTGIITYGNCNCRNCSNDSCQLNASSCRCDVQNDVMRKPLAKNSPDYGIHRVYVREKPYGKTDTIKKHRNTIAMFALSDTYSNRLFSYSNQNDTCNCEECECLVCKDKGKLINYDDQPKFGININKKSIHSGYCVPCQCDTCKKYYDSNPENFDENFSFQYKYNTENNKKIDESDISKDEKLFKRSRLTFASPEVNSLNKLLKSNDVLVNDVFSKKSEDLVEDEHCYLLKRGKLLTPSILKKIVLKRGSSHVLVKREDNESRLKENDNKSNCFVGLNSSLCQQIKFADTCKQADSYHTSPSPNSSKTNSTSKEKETTEIFKHNSLDLINSNASNSVCDDLNDSIKKDVSDDLLHENLKLSKMEVDDPDTIISSQKHLIHSYKQTKESLNVTNVLNNNKIHLSSPKSMSLVQSLCKERNISINDRYTSKYLQSIEKFPLKTLKMEFNSIYSSDESQRDISKNDNDVNFGKVKNKIKIPQINDKNDSEAFVYGNIDIVKRETENTIPSITKTYSNLKETEIEDGILKDTPLKIESDVNNLDKEIKAQRMIPLVKINKERKANKPSKQEPELMLHNKQIKNKRYLELPDHTDTASSVIKFNAFDKYMKLCESVPLQNDTEQKNQEDILGRKIVYVSADALCNNPLEPNRKNSLKSVSQQTSAVPLYYFGPGQGSKALNKLQIEVNDLLNSPILQSKNTIDQLKISWNESNKTLKTISRMNDATSQTQRLKIAVDKEVDCNLLISAENIKPNNEKVDNTMLTKRGKRLSFDQKDQNSKANSVVMDSNETERTSDGLKATFVFLRKVSDHTVLLRWMIPRDVKEVEGYELQVDGRPVKKILNPSRCMAVLTCLPHCEKLLLTIRTITKHQNKHNPVTTVIYRAKKVRSGIL